MVDLTFSKEQITLLNTDNSFNVGSDISQIISPREENKLITES